MFLCVSAMEHCFRWIWRYINLYYYYYYYMIRVLDDQSVNPLNIVLIDLFYAASILFMFITTMNDSNHFAITINQTIKLVIPASVW